MISIHRFTPTAPEFRVLQDAIAQACARSAARGAVWNVWCHEEVFYVRGLAVMSPGPNAQLIGQAVSGTFYPLEEVKR